MRVRRLRDVHSLIADPFQIVVDARDGQHKSKIRGHQLLQRQQLHDAVVDLDLQFVDGVLFLEDGLARAFHPRRARNGRPDARRVRQGCPSRAAAPSIPQDRVQNGVPFVRPSPRTVPGLRAATTLRIRAIISNVAYQCDAIRRKKAIQKSMDTLCRAIVRPRATESSETPGDVRLGARIA